MVLSDIEITERCEPPEEYEHRFQPMIDPFLPHQVKMIDGKRIISCGLSSYGYDARLSNKFKVFETAYCPESIVDPKDFDKRCLIDVIADSIIIPPRSIVLGQTVEKFNIPRDVIVICIGKSTYTRCGVLINVATLEPEWEGIVTMEITNTGSLPAKVYADEGICQFLFLKASVKCSTSYSDKKGVYQNAEGISYPKV
jgi:dCTP deaminase